MTPSRHDDESPPRLAERFVRLVAGDEAWADVTTGDLREEFAAVRAARGPAAARRWYYRESLRLAQSAVRRAAAGALASLVHPQGDHVMHALLQETRLALRSLVREPLVSGIVLLTLALGLGANAATFGMVDALLLRPFPFRGVDRLAMVSENSIDDPFPQESVAPGNLPDFHQAASFERLAAFRWFDVNMAGTDRPERVHGFAVNGDFFRALGIQPSQGRLLETADTEFGRHRQVVISDGLWRRRFAASPSVVGTVVRLGGLPYTIIGIAPPRFDFPNGAELWVAMAFNPAERADRASHYITVFGRLKDGVTREMAAAELTAIYARIKTDHPDATRGRRMVVRTFTEGMVDIGMPQVLTLWQAAAILVLLIGCTNVANLLLARGAVRQREVAVRLAIGAGRGRLIRQLLIESLVLALVASPLAIGVAAISFTLLRAGMPAELIRFIPGWNEMGVNGTVMAFTVGAAVLTALVFGLLPALQASRPALTAALGTGGRSVTSTAARGRLRRGLVIAEIALALPLLIASALAAIGAQRFATGPQGYDPDGVLRLRTMLDEAEYPDDASRRRFAEQLIEAARAQPGVTQAATATILPSTSSNQQRALAIEGRPPDPEHPVSLHYRAVSPDYLDTMRVPILEGRGFTAADRDGAEPVAIVSQSAAARHWPNGTALGQRIRLGTPDRPWTTIVGISADTIDDWFGRRRAPTVYVPVAQAPSALVNLVVRTTGDPAALAEGARAALAEVDPDQPPFDVMTMRDGLRIRTTGLRFVGALMAVFGAVALVLAAIGIYSVMAFFVAQRAHEMGIRMALGATAGDVQRLTIGQGARMAGVGIVIGLLLGVALGRFMETALFGVIALEPWLFAAIASVLALVALLASVIPARHAASTDPMRALRAE